MKIETVIFDTTVPHPEPVNVAGLLTDIEGVIKRHVVLSEPAATALAVWVLHTYTFECRDTVAYVAIESPEKRCGKTTLLSVLAAMARKSLIASNITVGALFRAIHTCSPTLFIDEADTFLAGNSIMRGIINSGNTRRTAYVLRLSAARKGSRIQERLASTLAPPESGNVRRLANSVPDGSAPPERGGFSADRRDACSTTETTETGLRKYSCWCPKVIAMIGQAPDTIADRSIVVKMARKLTTETCAPLADLDTAEIKAKCARFALDAREIIAQSPKIRNESLNDRAADTFDPLFVIAGLAGPEWEQKLRAAAVALYSTADTENSGAGLMMDIIDIFAESGREKMFSRDMVLLLRDGGMNSQARKNSLFNEHQLARVLRPYGVKPTAMRIGREVRNGYFLTDFRDAVKRYIPVPDLEAHLDESHRRWQLQVEAAKETEKHQVLLEKVKPLIGGRKSLTESEMHEIFDQLKNDPEVSDMLPARPGATAQGKGLAAP